MSVLFRRSFKTAIFSRFLKVAIATSNFMNEVYNGGFFIVFVVVVIIIIIIIIIIHFILICLIYANVTLVFQC